MAAFGKIVASYIFNDDMKAKLIKQMNDNVDIPFISEATEEKILTAIWESVEDVVTDALINSK
jgi:hypothetical protein